ncbi:MAG: EFR1 family ferrodoxin [Desulfarculaceae bacterium]|jgi:ferredoxin
MKILLSLFSATGNTAVYAGQIASRLQELGAEVELLDVTTPEARQTPPDFSAYDTAVFGSPIHSMRAPRLMRKWLAGLAGKGRRCAMFFTFGGFQIHPTHFDTRRILQESGFIVVASAHFPGAHTYNLSGWQAMADRPDEQDLALAREYAGKIFKRLSGEDQGVVHDLNPGPYTGEQLDRFEQFRFKVISQLPSRKGQECQMCMLCEEQCPAGAIEAEVGEAKMGLCIVCLRCVRNCPDQVLAINDASPFFKIKMEMDQETAETLAQKRGKIYL